MAKHRKRRKFRRYLKGNIDFQLALVTLAGDTLLGANAPDSVTETAWLSSVKASYALRAYTVAAGDGPVVVGLAHSDYTDAEIEEWMENTTSWQQGNKIAQEKAKRFIRQIGVFSLPLNAAEVGDISLNDGRLITTKCGWLLTTGQTVKFWAYNSASGALTTGSVFHVNGHANLWPN